MAVNLSTNSDELIVIINEKLMAIGSEVRVDEWFSVARLRQLAPLTAQQIQSSIFHPAPVKVINYARGKQKTTVEMAAALGDVLTTPRELWGNREVQMIASAFCGVVTVVNVPAADDVDNINCKYAVFRNQFTIMSLENRAFFAVMDPVTVVVNFQGAAPPEGYNAFISALLTQPTKIDAVISDQTTTDPPGTDSAAHNIWPSGTAPSSVADSYSIFMCASGTVEQMLEDARVLGERITGKFPTLKVYKMMCSGVPTECVSL